MKKTLLAIHDYYIGILNGEIQDVLTNTKRVETKYQGSKKLSSKVQGALDDLEENHNTSWAVEMYRRNVNNLKKTAIFYRGNKISYEEMFTEAYRYAKSLKAMGYEKGSEIPVCVTNIPEFVYLLLAISFIGAKINVIGEWFDEDYLVSILEKTGSKHIFLSDDIQDKEKIIRVIDKVGIEDIIAFSLTDSLPKFPSGKNYNPYESLDFCEFSDKTDKFAELTSKKVINAGKFKYIGFYSDKKVVEECSIDDPFAITYTSGTTDPGCPKGCLHSNRSYVTLSRFKESDVSGMPSMRNLTVLAHIPTYTHMELSCAISDTLYEGCTLTMEPFYDKDFFIRSLLINKPNFVPASNGFWGTACKLLNYDDRYKNVNLPFLMIPTVTGEACSIGEEKFFNYTSRKHKFGCDKLPFPLAPVTFSIGGGTSESSGIFVTLFKGLQEKALNHLIKKETLGLTPHKFVDLEVLDGFGRYCQVGEPGRLVANSPCSMIGYTNPELNKNIYITDNYGKTWLDLGTYSYKSDSYGRVKMKGRLNSNIYSTSTDEMVPYYRIEDEVSKDTKNILVCSLVKVMEDNKVYYVCHIELQPEAKLSVEKTLESAAMRLQKSIPADILDILYFRIRSFEESFPIAPSGKRNTEALREEGLSEKCIPCSEFLKLDRKNVKKRQLQK